MRLSINTGNLGTKTAFKVYIEANSFLKNGKKYIRIIMEALT